MTTATTSANKRASFSTTEYEIKQREQEQGQQNAVIATGILYKTTLPDNARGVVNFTNPGVCLASIRTFNTMIASASMVKLPVLIGDIEVALAKYTKPTKEERVTFQEIGYDLSAYDSALDLIKSGYFVSLLQNVIYGQQLEEIDLQRAEESLKAFQQFIVCPQYRDLIPNFKELLMSRSTFTAVELLISSRLKLDVYPNLNRLFTLFIEDRTLYVTGYSLRALAETPQKSFNPKVLYGVDKEMAECKDRWNELVDLANLDDEPKDVWVDLVNHFFTYHSGQYPNMVNFITTKINGIDWQTANGGYDSDASTTTMDGSSNSSYDGDRLGTSPSRFLRDRSLSDPNGVPY